MVRGAISKHGNQENKVMKIIISVHMSKRLQQLAGIKIASNATRFKVPR